MRRALFACRLAIVAGVWILSTPPMVRCADLTAPSDTQAASADVVAPPDQLLSSWPQSNWPQWRGPHRNGVWPGPPIAAAWMQPDLAVRWRKPLGGGYAGIVSADGRVITMDRATDPREVERVRCYRESNGELIWSHDYDVAYGDLDYGNGPRAAPTIDGEFVYTVGAVGHVFCLKVATGEVVWSTHLQESLHGRRPTWGYAASPLVEKDFVILQPGGLDGYSVVALRKESGELVWHSLADDAGYTWPVVAPRPDHTQLVCWTPSHIRGVNFEDGRPLWEIPYEVTYGVAIATPVYVDGLVFVSGYWNGSKAIRLGPEPADAQLVWVDDDSLRGLMAQPLVRGEHAYLLDKGRGLTCFELATGRKVWDDGNRLTPRGRNPQASLVWIGDTDRALALNSDGELVQARLTPAGYEELARARVCGPTWAHPAYVNRSIIARTDEEIVCCDLPIAE